MFNRYSYALNDPVNLTDPDGRCPICAVALAVIYVADKAYGAYDAAQTAKAVANGEISAADAAVSQATSQAAGAIAGPVGRGAAKVAQKADIAGKVKAIENAVRTGDGIPLDAKKTLDGVVDGMVENVGRQAGNPDRASDVGGKMKDLVDGLDRFDAVTDEVKDEFKDRIDDAINEVIDG